MNTQLNDLCGTVANEGSFAQHLRTRGLKPWHYAWIDWEGETVTFPLSGPYNVMAGYQRYSWRLTKKTKYFTYVSEQYRHEAVWGFAKNFQHGPLFITEGIWDAISVNNCWFDCVASLTCSPSREWWAWLRNQTGSRRIIAVCDNDDSGKRLGCQADGIIIVPNPWKDTNEMPEKNLIDLLTSWKAVL